MRFCPFCSAENPEGATHCGGCSRKLPPVPPRRRHRTSGPPPSDPKPAKADEAPVAEIVESEATEPTGGATSLPPPAPGRLPPVPARRQRDRAAAQRRASAPSLEDLAARADSASGSFARRRPSEPARPTPPSPQPSTDDGWDTGPQIAPKLEPAPEASGKNGQSTVAEPRRLKPTGPPAPDHWADSDGDETPAPLARRRASRSDESEEFTTPPTQTSMDEVTGETPTVDPIPEVPEGGLFSSVTYLLAFVKGRWQRRAAIRTLKEQIASDTASLDAILGILGETARDLGIDNRVLSAENQAIDQAEDRKERADREFGELQNRQAEENNRFAEIESDRQEKVNEADEALEEAKRELGSLEAQRRGLRDKRKDIERRQRGLLKAAEDREAEAGKLPMGDERAGLRRSAEELRRDAAELDPERQDIDRRLAALDRPIGKVTAKVESLKAELESARRSLNDAREGHRHRLSEIEAEKGRKSRELAQADAEIARRMVTLGTLVNLNRVERPEFDELYGRIDVLRSAIGARTTEIDRHTVERDAYDKRILTRGALVLGGSVILLCLLLAILL